MQGNHWSFTRFLFLFGKVGYNLQTQNKRVFNFKMPFDDIPSRSSEGILERMKSVVRNIWMHMMHVVCAFVKLGLAAFDPFAIATAAAIHFSFNQLLIVSKKHSVSHFQTDLGLICSQITSTVTCVLLLIPYSLHTPNCSFVHQQVKSIEPLRSTGCFHVKNPACPTVGRLLPEADNLGTRRQDTSNVGFCQQFQPLSHSEYWSTVGNNPPVT